MEIIKNNLDRVKTPGPGDKVFKDECFFSFDSPECERGLYVCLNRWIGVGLKHLTRYSNRTDNKIFLHIKRTRKVGKALCITDFNFHSVPLRRPKRSLTESPRKSRDWPSTWRAAFRRTKTWSGRRS